MSEAITPFTLAVEQAALDDLHRRLDLTRWPEKETVEDWTQGSPLASLWRSWLATTESRLNMGRVVLTYTSRSSKVQFWRNSPFTLPASA